MPPDGNFQDYVVLSQDTLSHKGPALLVGTTSASTVTYGFSNSAGLLNLVAAQTGNATLWLTGSLGTILTNVNLSAGTTSQNLSNWVYSNSNNVSFGLNGSTITASVTVASTQASVNFSAGTTSNNLSAVTFSNSNNVSFGLNGSTITASIATSLTAINVSAGTTSNNLSAITFSNSNGVSFGLNGSTITASIAAAANSSISMFSQDADFVTNFQISQATLSFQKFSIPMNLSATQLAFIADFEGASGSSAAVTVSHAIYSFNASTASLLSSCSSQFSYTSGSQTSASSRYGGASGTQYRTMTCAYSLTPGDYLAAWFVSTSNSVTVNMVGRAGINIVNTYDGFVTSMFLNGTSVSSTNALPSSIAATNTNYARTGSAVLRQPGMMLIGGTGL